MQLGPNEFWNYGGGDINHAADNIMAGAMYMKDLIGQFGGSAALALRGYNSGPHGVDLHDADATPAGTGDPTYVAKVMLVAPVARPGVTCHSGRRPKANMTSSTGLGRPSAPNQRA
jgi:soluble lytic murein transglycosylase-like protein